MNITELQDHIDQIRDVVYEAWGDDEAMRNVDEMGLFMDEVKKQIMHDYNWVYDQIGWHCLPSEYEEEDE